MIKIKKVKIKRFRSILNLSLDINTNNNLITICGENNAGKTNTLRAVNLFFNPSIYCPHKDSPSHKYEATRGGSVYPEIEITFREEKTNDVYTISRKFGKDSLLETKGHKKTNGSNQKKEELTDKQINTFLNKIVFYFLETINISFPDLISNFINDIYDVEYRDSRFRGLKKNLKESYDKYIQGLLDVLNTLAQDISPRFQEYKENWKVNFDIDQDVTKFRDLINQDVEFYINDKSNKVIENKGAGLQRLAHILLHFKIIEKIKNKSPIILIDEPNSYLHQGLQVKLISDIKNVCSTAQIFITTHEKLFIDSYTLSNVFLLELKMKDQFFTRKGKEYGVLDTSLVDLNDVEGERKIKSYLGISDDQFDIIENYNLLVEGESDAKYITELLNFFKIPIPNIKVSEGADNVPKYLEFYNSFHKNKPNKPKILVILDNDEKGRSIHQAVSNKHYNNINVKVTYIVNHQGEILADRGVNNEIEDFLYPLLVTSLTNEILKRKGFKQIDIKGICSKIDLPAHKANGILSLIETNKNDQNPNDGQTLKIDSETFKSGLANVTSISGNKKVIRILEESHEKYPQVKEFLEKISKPFD